MQRADGLEQCAADICIGNFREDAEPLFRHTGFTVELLHLNRSGRRADYRSYYSPCYVKAVGDACQEDIARFGFRFE